MKVTLSLKNNQGKLTKRELFISKLEKPTVSLQCSTTQPPSTQPTLSQSKLPELNLLTVDGNITDWFGLWKRFFQSQVGKSPDLPNAAKFTYLMGQLRREALATVKGPIPSDMNYSILQATLQENFGLPRSIIWAHVLTLLKMQKPTFLASSLRQFYNALMGDICLLESLNNDAAACLPFIVPIIEDKLRRKVLNSIGDCGKEVSFNLKGFIEWLKTYITCKEQVAGANWPTSPKTTLATYETPSMYSTLAAPVNIRCQQCKGSYATQHSPQFTTDKTATVISNNLCFNCLHPGHRALQFNAKGHCAKCRGKHHRAIHGIQIHSNAKNHNPH